MSDNILWGAEAIGRAANILNADGEVDIRRVFYRLELGHLPGKKVGRVWTSTRDAIHRTFEIKPNVTASTREIS
jgi:hypothetical protein